MQKKLSVIAAICLAFACILAVIPICAAENKPSEVFKTNVVYQGFGGSGDGLSDASPIGTLANALKVIPDGGTMYAATGKKIAIQNTTFTFPAVSQGILVTAVAFDETDMAANGNNSFKLTAGSKDATAVIAEGGIVEFDHIKLIAEGGLVNKILVKSGAALIVTDDVTYTLAGTNAKQHYTVELESGAVAYLSKTAQEKFTIVNNGGSVCDYDPSIEEVYIGYNGKGSGLTDDSPLGGSKGASSVAAALALMPEGGTIYAATGKKIAIQNTNFTFPATKNGILITAPAYDPEATGNANDALKLTTGAGKTTNVTLAENAVVTLDRITLVSEAAGDSVITVKNGAVLTVTDEINPTLYNGATKHFKLNIEEGGTAVLSAIALDTFEIMNNGTVLSYDADFDFASVTLENDFVINFYAADAQFDGCTDVGVTFTKGGVPTEVTDYTVRTVNGADYRVYRYEEIDATEIGETVSAKIHLTRGDFSLSGAEVTYSVKDYAVNMLARTTDENLKTLLVDLLNYGAAAQTYFGADAEDLINKDLTEEEKAYATAEDPALTSIAAVGDAEGKLITAEGASLTLGSNVIVNFYFTDAGYTKDAASLSLKVTCGKETEILDGGKFVKTASGWKVSFASLNATELSETITAVVCSAETGEELSSTVTYSAESYAADKQHDANADLADLVNAMMKYGNSAVRYFASKEG